MGTPIKLCVVCKVVINNNSVSPSTWTAGDLLIFKDGIHMVKCQECHSIAIWEIIDKPSYGKVKFNGFIDKFNSEYLIWKLK